jgi:hypothetical protein
VWLSELMGTTSEGIESTTPLARLTSDALVWVVRADSKFQNAQSVIDAVKRDPVAVSFGVGTIPSDDQFNILRPLRASGVDISTLKMAAFRSGGDLMTNLLGGHVDVVSASFSEAEGQAAAGRVRMLATASAVRMAGPIGGGVPTWRELGLDVAVSHWRGVFGPPGMSPQAVRYWDDYFSKLVKTDAWEGRAGAHRTGGRVSRLRGVQDRARRGARAEQALRRRVCEPGVEVRQAERAFTWTDPGLLRGLRVGVTKIDMRLGATCQRRGLSAGSRGLHGRSLHHASRRFATSAGSQSASVGSHPRGRGISIGQLTSDEPKSSSRQWDSSYWLSLPWLGYVVATSLFLLVGTLSLGERVSLRPFVVSIATAAALWVVFVLLLGVPLPDLPLGFD